MWAAAASQHVLEHLVIVEVHHDSRDGLQSGLTRSLHPVMPEGNLVAGVRRAGDDARPHADVIKRADQSVHLVRVERVGFHLAMGVGIKAGQPNPLYFGLHGSPRGVVVDECRESQLATGTLYQNGTSAVNPFGRKKSFFLKIPAGSVGCGFW
jgi:hypothetical protein